MPVYPRWRGEHFCYALLCGFQLGLSPLARGTHCGGERQTGHHRFIPAGAGNTPFQYMIYPSVPVYPRWRGEHTKTIYLF